MIRKSASRSRALVVGLSLLLLAGCTMTGIQPSAPRSRGRLGGTADIHKIQHVIVIMQENRSLDM